MDYLQELHKEEKGLLFQLKKVRIALIESTYFDVNLLEQLLKQLVDKMEQGGHEVSIKEYEHECAKWTCIFIGDDAYEISFAHTMKYQLQKDKLHVTFGFLWNRARNEIKEITESHITSNDIFDYAPTNFYGRSYIREFLQFVVNLRLDYKPINYDYVVNQFVAEYKAKQKVLQPNKPQD